jgi:hypothetical protein
METMIDARTKRELVRAIQTLQADCRFRGDIENPLYQAASVLLTLLDETQIATHAQIEVQNGVLKLQEIYGMGGPEEREVSVTMYEGAKVFTLTAKRVPPEHGIPMIYEMILSQESLRMLMTLLVTIEGDYPGAVIPIEEVISKYTYGHWTLDEALEQGILSYPEPEGT